MHLEAARLSLIVTHAASKVILTFHLDTGERYKNSDLLSRRAPDFYSGIDIEKSHLHGRTTSNALDDPNADRASRGDLRLGVCVDGETKALTTTHIQQQHRGG
jgi:hypothetical protein